MKSDYIRTARAKGLSSWQVVLSHSFRNALLPIITLSALLFGELLAGAVLTEQIFTIPGFGKLIVDAVFTRDYAVVQGVVLCTAIGFILISVVMWSGSFNLTTIVEAQKSVLNTGATASS